MLISKEDFSLVNKKPIVFNEEAYFEVDDIIAPTISILNKKGYYTRYSCGSHFPLANHIYIMFDALYVLPVLDSFQIKLHIPTLENDKTGMIIETRVGRRTGYTHVLELHKDLFEWAESLPSPVNFQNVSEHLYLYLSRNILDITYKYRHTTDISSDYEISRFYKGILNVHKEGLLSKDDYDKLCDFTESLKNKLNKMNTVNIMNNF